MVRPIDLPNLIHLECCRCSSTTAKMIEPGVYCCFYCGEIVAWMTDYNQIAVYPMQDARKLANLKMLKTSKP